MSLGRESWDARGMMTACLAIFLVLTASGCARSDWIQSTLVTVDVTGIWRGTFARTGGGGDVELTLQQRGPKVTGQLKLGAGSQGEMSIEGTVTGDISLPRREGSSDRRTTGERGRDDWIGPGISGTGIQAPMTFRVRLPS